MFDDIILAARKSRQKNISVNTKRVFEADLKKKQEEADKRLRMVVGYSNADYRVNNCSAELLSLIEKHRFVIKSYEKNNDFDEDEYFPILETYHCSYNDWKFDVSNCSDCDIDEGIFRIDSLRNSKTDQKVKFYCDLGCRNTGEDRLERFLKFLEYDSEESFIKEFYREHLLIPDLLKKKGVDVINIDNKYSLEKINTVMTVKNNLYIVVYKGWHDDVRLIVTNDKKWDVNSSNELSNMFLGSRGYYFDYKSEEDIDELIKCMYAFEEHIKGNIGYLESGRYCNNIDISRYFESLNKPEIAHEQWNHYHIRVDMKNQWDGRGYGSTLIPIVNKYKGIEISKVVELTFNDAAQWSIGDEINKSIITILYDKNIDKENCLLTIENYIFESSDNYIIEDYDDDLDEYITNHNSRFLVGKLEFKGSFSYIMQTIDAYVKKMCEIYNIPV